ncbi:APC family permease [Mesorhizobium sp. B4-1-3]|uniref:APC family permease n=1 Tax=Mesorhizobium sp. B4-1-3 TaxID=2589889 RepID=UPI00112E05C8|nr:APC family permease [Mesorhizobium sp. B4-1-3]TPI08293.1 APC family permease [Mesorhizobium sp. B4-1-3]
MTPRACVIDLNLLLVVSGTSLVVIYALLCIAVFAGRRNGTTSGGHYRMPLFPVPAILAFVALIYVAYQNWLDAPSDAEPDRDACDHGGRRDLFPAVPIVPRRLDAARNPTNLPDRRQPSDTCPCENPARRRGSFFATWKYGRENPSPNEKPLEAMASKGLISILNENFRPNNTCRTRPDAGSFRSA